MCNYMSEKCVLSSVESSRPHTHASYCCAALVWCELGINIQDGDAAIMDAASAGHLAVLNALLQAGADPNATNEVCMIQSFSAVYHFRTLEFSIILNIALMLSECCNDRPAKLRFMGRYRRDTWKYWRLCLGPMWTSTQPTR